MPGQDIYLNSIGVYLPPTVSTEWAEEQGLREHKHSRVNGLTGAAVAGDMPAPEMALKAAQEAFQRSGHPAGDIDLLVYADVWHQGPDGWQPQYYLQHHLVGPRPLSVELHHGCSGMFSALELAVGYLRGDPDRSNALLVSSENFGTPLIDRWRSSQEDLMGDGACAVILTKKPGFAQLLAASSVTIPGAEGMHRGDEPLFPPGVTTGRNVDFGARAEAFNEAMAKAGDSPTSKIGGHLLLLLRQVLEETDLDIEDMARTVFMNASRSFTELIAAAVGVPLSMSTWDYGRTIGHVGASDHIISLDHLLLTGQLKPGDHVLMLGIGPGVTLTCAVVKILALPSWITS